MNKVSYEIEAHEDGWAVVVDGVIQAIYPSEDLAKKSLQNTRRQGMSTQAMKNRVARKSPTLVSSGGRPVVSVPDNVTLPLKDNADEVRVPVDISGRDLSTGKL